MNCDEFKESMHSVMDGRAGEAEGGFDQHARECDACSRAYQNMRLISKTMHDRGLYYAAPDRVRERAMKLGRASALPARRTWQTWHLFAAAASVAIVLTASWAIWRSSTSSDDLVAHDVVASHIRSLMANHQTDVLSSDRHTVKPWFAGKLPFSPRVDDFSAQNFKLIGGRLDYIADAPVAALVYQRRQHTINVFTWPARESAAPVRALNRRGYNVLHWSAAGMEYWAVSELAANELEELKQLIEERDKSVIGN
ncbi:MAG TPA: anti-sigma factor [Planctomycetota bacterium]|nr:anti-sigma factor [Planctomycetota bacterium]